MLGQQIESQSGGRYSVYLPQDYEPEHLGPKAIRDSDFEALLSCDAAVFQFDGTELDSGTVAEFMAAKFADIPSVLLRTDFRRAGDRNDDSWNLMCSFYPRSVSVAVDAIHLYSKFDTQKVGGVAASQKAFEELANQVVGKLDEVSAQDPVKLEGASREEALRLLLGI